jgi:release factor glutamine methyltransferase
LKLREVAARVRRRLEAAVAPEPEIESRLLLAHALGMTQAKLLASMPDDAPHGAEGLVEPLLLRRVTREPLAYVLGVREFYGRPLRVDRRVLVPRPETELLVDLAIEFAAGVEATDRPRGRGLRVADVGTGSGALAVTLALELPEAEVWASDLSVEALEVARMNGAALCGPRRVRFVQGDLASALTGRYDVVVANLPYLPTYALESAEPELRFEPRDALDGGPDGLRVIERLLSELTGVLSEGPAVALFEVDPRNAGRAAEIARAAVTPAAVVDVVPDLAGLDRCVRVQVGD